MSPPKEHIQPLKIDTFHKRINLKVKVAVSAAGGHGGGLHRAKLAHVQRQTGGDGDGGDGGVALTLVAHKEQS